MEVEGSVLTLEGANIEDWFARLRETLDEYRLYGPVQTRGKRGSRRPSLQARPALLGYWDTFQGPSQIRMRLSAC